MLEKLYSLFSPKRKKVELSKLVLTDSPILYDIKTANIGYTGNISWSVVHILNTTSSVELAGNDEYKSYIPIHIISSNSKYYDSIIGQFTNQIIKEQMQVIEAFYKAFPNEKINGWLAMSSPYVFPEFQNEEIGFYGWQYIGIAATAARRNLKFAKEIERNDKE